MSGKCQSLSVNTALNNYWMRFLCDMENYQGRGTLSGEPMAWLHDNTYPASSLVASVGNRDQWKNNRSAGLNGNAIEREATRKSRIQDGVRCNGRDNANREDFSSSLCMARKR
jgi:hypothetical protein